jgi:hypothetical protein
MRLKSSPNAPASTAKGTVMPGAPTAFCLNASGTISGPPIDPCPVQTTPVYQTAEYIWEVNSLGLSAGTYNA